MAGNDGGFDFAALAFQFRVRKYVPGIYWLGVVLISVVGTQITDNLTDNLGVSLVTTTIVFSVALPGPCEKNPIDRLSGDQNGKAAPSVPSSARVVVPLSVRTHRRMLPF